MPEPFGLQMITDMTFIIVKNKQLRYTYIRLIVSVNVNTTGWLQH